MEHIISIDSSRTVGTILYTCSLLYTCAIVYLCMRAQYAKSLWKHEIICSSDTVIKKAHSIEINIQKYAISTATENASQTTKRHFTNDKAALYQRRNGTLPAIKRHFILCLNKKRAAGLASYSSHWKSGGLLLSRIALQYHRRKRA